jgi:hypothetical protein
MRAICACIPAFVLAMAVPAIARADEKKAPEKERRLSLETSADFMTGTVNGGTITKADVHAGVAYDVTRRFTLRIGIGIGTMRIGYAGPLDDGFKVNAALWSYAGLSGYGGASYKLYDGKMFRLDGYAEFESSIVHSHPVITSLDATTPQGTFDITPYANANTGGSIYWNRFAAGARGRFIVGRVEPNLGISFQRVEASLDLHLNDDSRKTIAQLGYDPLHIEGRHDMSFWMIPITAGVDFRLGRASWLGANGMFAPAGDNYLWGTSLLFRQAF